MLPNVVVPIVACVAALLLTPLTTRLAHLKGWVDRPGLRKVHSLPVAYLGGAAVMGALLVALTSTFWIPSATSFIDSFDRRIGAIIVGALLMFSVGIVDDVKDIKATKKLLAQLAAATLVFASGVSIEGLTLAEGFRIEFGVFSAFVTIFWIVGVTNALNIIDGLDGLASGISIVACGAIAWTAFQNDHQAAGILMLALMGAITGFLPYNIHPARVFLGDAGSLTIGFLLSSTAALTATKAPTMMGLGVPLVALGIPILDTLFSMGRRVIERRSMLSADRNHLHHRLMALGYGQPKTVLLLCTVTAVAVTLTTLSASSGNFVRAIVLIGAFMTYTAVFRATGAVRFRDSIAAVGRVASDAKVVNDEKQAVDQLELQFREADDVAQWWSAVSEAAERLSFAEVSIDLSTRDGASHPLRWAKPSFPVHDAPYDPQSPTFEIPIPDRRVDQSPVLRVKAGGRTPLDVVGRRMALFCRLMTEHSLASLPRTEREHKPIVRPRPRAVRA